MCGFGGYRAPQLVDLYARFLRFFVCARDRCFRCDALVVVMMMMLLDRLDGIRFSRLGGGGQRQMQMSCVVLKDS